MKMQYYGNCTQMDGDDVIDIMDVAKEVGYNTITKYVSVSELNNMFGTRPSLKNEPNASFYVSSFHGKKCVVVRHSAIEYIFI